MVIPAGFRKALGIQVGDPVILALDDGEVRLFTIDQAVRRAQQIYRHYVPDGYSLADELIAERRLESEQE